jgi:hypothetical protein
MEKCKLCQQDGTMKLVRINQEHVIEDKTCVVENILALECGSCGAKLLTEEGEKHLKVEISAFANEGLYMYFDELRGGDSLEQIGTRMGGKSRQNVFRTTKNFSRMELLSAFKFASAMNVPFSTLFVYRPLEFRDGKYYLGKPIA